MSRGELFLYLRGGDLRAHESALVRVEESRPAGSAERVYGIGLITLSTNCTRDCIYCWFSSGMADYRHFRLGMGEIMAGAEAARRAGVRTLVLRSGDDPGYSAEALAEVIRGLTSRFDFDLVPALGERRAPVYAMWREAGAKGYWLRHETCDPILYRRVRPSMFGVDRMRSLKAVQESGLALASGTTIGLPNQTYESLAEDLMFFADQGPDRTMFGMALEAFWPPPQSAGSEMIKRPEHVIVEADRLTFEKALAVSRLMRPDIVSTLSNPVVKRFSALADGRLFRAGANALFLDFTPARDERYEQTAMSGVPIRGAGDLAAVRSSLASLGLKLSLDRPILPGA